jgi:acylphosphatase
MLAKHCRIEGQVQGVGYRQALQYEAEKLGLTGWVRNRRDGSVEAIACGNEAALAQFIAWTSHGPYLAKVRQVLVTEAECPENHSFVILATE